MKAFILLGLVFVVILISGCVYFPDLDVPNTSVEGYTIKSDKTSYKIGEPVEFTGEFEQKIYEMNWYKPVIYRKESGIWSKMDFDCGCIDGCNSINRTAAKNTDCGYLVLECREPPMCTEMSPQKVWVWDQTYCNKEKVECIGDYDVYCRHGMEPVGPGTYKVEFTLTRECTGGTFDYENENYERIMTNEFIIKDIEF